LLTHLFFAFVGSHMYTDCALIIFLMYALFKFVNFVIRLLKRLTVITFCRAMLCKRGLCHHALSVCLTVCVSVTFVHSVKTNKDIFNFFSPPGSHTILVFFRTKQHGNIPMRTPLTGTSNAGVVGRNRDSEPISGFTACCVAFQRQVQYT